MLSELTGSDELAAFIASIDQSPISTVVTDFRLPDNPIIAANAAFAELTGYAREEIIGRNCRFLTGAGTEPEARRALHDAIVAGRPIVVELTNYRKDGTPFSNAVMIAPIRDHSGKVALFVGSQMDVSGRNPSGLRRERASKQVAALTPRLRDVLELVAAGFRNKQIGAMLGITEKTVKMHRARLLSALGAKSTADAVRIAVEAGLAATDRG